MAKYSTTTVVTLPATKESNRPTMWRSKKSTCQVRDDWLKGTRGELIFKHRSPLQTPESRIHMRNVGQRKENEAIRNVGSVRYYADQRADDAACRSIDPGGQECCIGHWLDQTASLMGCSLLPTCLGLSARDLADGKEQLTAEPWAPETKLRSCA